MTMRRTLAQEAERLARGESSFGRYLIPGVIPAKGLTVLFGPTGSLKTQLACSTAVDVAAGRIWCGSRIERGGVLYIASEDRDGVVARMAAEARSRSLDLEDVPICFISPPDLVHGERWREKVTQEAKETAQHFSLPVKLIVLDTLGANFGALSQDDAAPMSRSADNMLNVCELLDCACLTVHHTGKQAKLGMRGSQVLNDRADAVIELQPKGEIITAQVVKQRNGPAGHCFTFGKRIYQHGEQEQTIILDGLSLVGNTLPNLKGFTALPSPARQREGKNAHLMQRLIDRFLEDGAHEVATKQIRRQFYDAHEATNKSTLRGAFNEARDAKIASGVISEANGTITLSVGKSVGVGSVGNVGDTNAPNVGVGNAPLIGACKPTGLATGEKDTPT